MYHFTFFERALHPVEFRCRTTEPILLARSAARPAFVKMASSQFNGIQISIKFLSFYSTHCEPATSPHSVRAVDRMPNVLNRADRPAARCATFAEQLSSTNAFYLAPRRPVLIFLFRFTPQANYFKQEKPYYRTVSLRTAAAGAQPPPPPPHEQPHKKSRFSRRSRPSRTFHIPTRSCFG